MPDEPSGNGGESKPKPTAYTAKHCKTFMWEFISKEKPLLNPAFYKVENDLDTKGSQAANMAAKLIDAGCGRELALQFTVLLLYDLVILLDDSTSMGIEEDGARVQTLQKVLEEVAMIYTMANEDGIVSVRFLNMKRAFGKIKQGQVKKLVQKMSFWGVTRIGTELQKKILDPFVFKRKSPEQMKRPLLVMIITDGAVEGEDPEELEETILTCFKTLKEDKEKREHVSLYFARIGNNPDAQKFISELDNHEKVNQHIDCLPVNNRLEDIELGKDKDTEKEKGKYWMVLQKLLLGALYREVDQDDDPHGKKNKANFDDMPTQEDNNADLTDEELSD